MAPFRPAISQPATQVNSFQKIALIPLLFFLYALVSRLLDISFYYLHLPLVLSTISAICALLAGRLFVGLNTRAGILYLLLTCYFMAGVLFSVWRGGSVHVITDSWIRSMLTWLMVVGLITSYTETKYLLNTIAFAVITAGLLGVFQGAASADGRLALRNGRFNNPNDFALVLLIGLPFLWRLYYAGGRPGIFRRLMVLAASCPVLLSFLKAGSRGGLFALILMLTIAVSRASLMTKIKAGVSIVVFLALVFAALPNYLRQRYLTFSTVDEQSIQSTTEELAVGHAAASTESRRALLGESISVTLHHPVFGIGLGNFAVYESNLAKARGEHAVWLGTHNTYTQLSSEAGIPALAIFITILVLSWRSLSRVIRATRADFRPLVRDIHCSAQASQVCLASVCFFIVFGHIAYDPMLHLITAVAVVVSRTAEKELARQTLPGAAPTKEPSNSSAAA